MNRPGTARIVLTFGALCLIWGTTWSVIQIGLRGMPPFTGAGMRFTIAAAILFVLSLVRGVRLGQTRIERRLWVVNGLCSFAISYGVVYWAEQWVPSGLAAVLFATYPFFVALLAAFVLPEEKVSARELAGMVVGFGGVGLIFSEDMTRLGGPDVAIAAAVMLLSPIAAAVGSVVVKRWNAGMHHYAVTVVPMALAGAALGSVGLATEDLRAIVWNGESVGALLYLAIAGSAVTFSLYYWLLTHLPAKRLALIAYVVPLVALAVGTLRGEPLTARTLAGSGLVVAGVALAVQRLGR